VLDFCLVILSAFSKARSLQVLRICRALRPLRFLNRLASTKALLNCIWSSVGDFCNIMLIWALFSFIWGIIGVNLFNGLYYSCNDTGMPGKIACIGTFRLGETTGNISQLALEGPKGSPFLAPRVWDTPDRSFDNIGQGIATLFKVSTLDDWSTVMYHAMDGTKIDQQPSYNNQAWMSIYFLIYVTGSSFFLLQLLVSVVIENLSKVEGEDTHTSHELHQRDLALLMSIMWGRRQARRLRPVNSGIRQFCYDICIDCFPRADCEQHATAALVPPILLLPDGENESTAAAIESTLGKRRFHCIHSHFESAILIVVLLNLVVMLCEHYGQSDEWSLIIKAFDFTFIGIYCVEVAIKIIALGICGYFSDEWNIFDFIVILTSLIFRLIGEAGIGWMRLGRLLRVLRMIQRQEDIRLLCNGLIIGLQSAGDVMVLFVVFLFIYGILYTKLLGDLKLGFSMDGLFNFYSFGNTAITLFRVSTHEWVSVAEDGSLQPPWCSSSSNANGQHQYDDCGYSFWIEALTGFFFVGTRLVLFNVVAAMMLDKISGMYALEPDHILDALYINSQDLRIFMATWDRIDVFSQGYIPHRRAVIEALVKRIDDISSKHWFLSVELSEDWFNDLEKSLRHNQRIPGRVYIMEAFDALVYRHYRAMAIDKLTRAAAIREEHIPWYDVLGKSNTAKDHKSQWSELVDGLRSQSGDLHMAPSCSALKYTKQATKERWLVLKLPDSVPASSETQEAAPAVNGAPAVVLQDEIQDPEDLAIPPQALDVVRREIMDDVLKAVDEWLIEVSLLSPNEDLPKAPQGLDAGQRSRLLRLFGNIDTNQDGFISQEELQRAFTGSHGVGQRKQKAMEAMVLLDCMDTNEDKLVSKSEWLSFWQNVSSDNNNTTVNALILELEQSCICVSELPSHLRSDFI